MSDVDLRDVRVFVHIVDGGSLAEAARRLHVAKSSVSRAIARLESHVGEPLLHRTSRSVGLTERGRQYYESVARPMAAIEDATARETQDAPLRGVVRVAAPPAVGSEILPTAVEAFLSHHEEVTLEVELSSEPAKLLNAGFDLVVAGGPQPDSSLMIKRLLSSTFRLYASQSYLSKRGWPATVADLETHDAILFRTGARTMPWRLTGPSKTETVQVRGRVCSNSLAFVRRAAIAGLGIALLPELPGRAACEQGWLLPILDEMCLQGNDLHLIYRASPSPSRRTRAFIAFLEVFFKAQPGPPGPAYFE